MKPPSRFWVGMGLVLTVGIPCTLFARARLQPTGEAEHVHGGDPKLEADLAHLSGVARVTRLRQAAQDALPARRLAVAEALASERSAEGLALAKDLLTDNDSEVRLKAAFALAQRRSTCVWPVSPLIMVSMR